MVESHLFLQPYVVRPSKEFQEISLKEFNKEIQEGVPCRIPEENHKKIPKAVNTKKKQGLPNSIPEKKKHRGILGKILEESLTESQEKSLSKTREASLEES